MSKRAEQAALTAYPVHIIEHQKVMGGVIKIDTNTNPRFFFTEGYEQAEKDLGWRSVDETLPENGKQVIVLRLELSKSLKPSYRISFGEVKELARGKVWDVPGVKFWMPCPKLP